LPNELQFSTRRSKKREELHRGEQGKKRKDNCTLKRKIRTVGREKNTITGEKKRSGGRNVISLDLIINLEERGAKREHGGE